MTYRFTNSVQKWMTPWNRGKLSPSLKWIAYTWSVELWKHSETAHSCCHWDSVVMVQKYRSRRRYTENRSKVPWQNRWWTALPPEKQPSALKPCVQLACDVVSWSTNLSFRILIVRADRKTELINAAFLDPCCLTHTTNIDIRRINWLSSA